MIYEICCHQGTHILVLEIRYTGRRVYQGIQTYVGERHKQHGERNVAEKNQRGLHGGGDIRNGLKV